MQILHANSHHWVSAASMVSEGHQVSIFDSAYSNWDNGCYKVLQIQFRCSICNVKFVDVQKQTGSADCSLFVIANAPTIKATIAFNGNLSTIRHWCTSIFLSVSQLKQLNHFLREKYYSQCMSRLVIVHNWIYNKLYQILLSPKAVYIVAF